MSREFPQNFQHSILKRVCDVTRIYNEHVYLWLPMILWSVVIICLVFFYCIYNLYYGNISYYIVFNNYNYNNLILNTNLNKTCENHHSAWSQVYFVSQMGHIWTFSTIQIFHNIEICITFFKFLFFTQILIEFQKETESTASLILFVQ